MVEKSLLFKPTAWKSLTRDACLGSPDKQLLSRIQGTESHGLSWRLWPLLLYWRCPGLNLAPHATLPYALSTVIWYIRGPEVEYFQLLFYIYQLVLEKQMGKWFWLLVGMWRKPTRTLLDKMWQRKLKVWVTYKTFFSVACLLAFSRQRKL